MKSISAGIRCLQNRYCYGSFAGSNRDTTTTTEVLSVNKSELVEAIAAESELSKAEAERALNAFISTVSNALKKDDTVQLVGFGTFSSSQRGARVGKNPRTGEAIKIAARKVPKFAAGKGLKDLISGVKKPAAASKGAAKGASKGAAKGASKGGAKGGSKK